MGRKESLSYTKILSFICVEKQSPGTDHASTVCAVIASVRNTQKRGAVGQQGGRKKRAHWKYPAILAAIIQETLKMTKTCGGAKLKKSGRKNGSVVAMDVLAVKKCSFK